MQAPRVDLSNFSNYAIKLASDNGHLAVVQALLRDPTSDNENHAIIRASRNGHLAVVQELLEDPRVDPSDRNNESIRMAIHADVV